MTEINTDTKKDKKIVAAMSGGIDSSAAAYLLKQMGFAVAGVTFIMTDIPSAGDTDIGTAAASVCEAIGIPHYIHRHEADFLRLVIDPFVRAYETGLTPNPCVECNKYVKIPSAIAFAQSIGYAGAATGHYARIEKVPSGNRFLLKKAVDTRKDQSYVLWTLNQDMLSKLMFPLGEMSKDKIREIVREAGLPSADKKESQDICFIPDGDYVSFIERYREGNVQHPVSGRGNYIDLNGNVIGSHNGQIRYTIGQRKGLGVSFGRHMFVIAKDADKNTVTLDGASDKGSEPAALYTNIAKANKINLIACDDLKSPVNLAARLRYHQKESPARAEQTGADELTLIFSEPQRAVTKGQSLVMYDGDTVVGGGVII